MHPCAKRSTIQPMNNELNEQQPEEPTEEEQPQSKIVTDELDIDAALAAVARLGEIAEAAERSQYAAPIDITADDEPTDVIVAEDESDEVEQTDLDDQLDEEIVDVEDDEPSDAEIAESIEDVALEIDTSEFDEETYYDEYDPDDLAMEPIAESIPEIEPQSLAPEPSFSQVESTFTRPPLMRLQRGQAASVTPALLLIASGAWLTFALTTGASLPDPLTLMSVGLGAVGVIFLSLWLSSQRWAQGGFFVGAWLLLSSIVLIYLFQPTELDFQSGWSLLIVAFGAAWALTGFMTFPRRVPFGLVGVIIAIGGILGTGILSNRLDARLLDIAQSLLPFALVFLFVIIVIPIISRRRRAQ